MAGQGLNVQGSSTGFPYVPLNSSNPIQGMLRINNQDLQVFDGSTWMNVAMGYPTVELNSESQSLLQWARQKRDEELKLKSLIEKHPGLKEAYERLEIMKALTLEEEQKHD